MKTLAILVGGGPAPGINAVIAAATKIRVRYVDVESEMYQTLWAYMIRLKPEDFDDPAWLATLAKAAHLGNAEFAARFGPLVGR